MYRRAATASEVRGWSLAGVAASISLPQTIKVQVQLMPQKAPMRKSWLRVAAGFLLVILIVLSAFVITSNRAFYSAPAADLPCRQCAGAARAVHVNGFDLYARELGVDAGHASIVVIHGGPGHSSESFKGSLDFLAQAYHVLYYDQRGSGYSQIKPDASLYTVEQLIDELETIRRDVLGADKLILIAHSAGGALAQRYALAHGDHVEKLILVSSIHINNGIGSPAVWDALNPALFALGAGWPPADPEAANQWVAPIMVASSVPRLYDKSRRDFIEDGGYLSFATWREVSRSLEGQDYQDQLRALRTKTLIIYGAADNAYTGEATATALHAVLPESTLVRFEQSGHWAFLEEPDRFKQVVGDFLKSGD